MFSFPALAAQTGFAQKKFDELEKKIRKEFELEFIAKKLTELRTFSQWPDDITSDLKVYIAVSWHKQKYNKQASELLLETFPSKEFQDLWSYEQALLLSETGKSAKATNLVSELQKKYPDDVDFLFLKSVYLAGNNKLIEAVETISKVIKRDKKNGKYYLQRALYYIMAISHDLAIKDLHKSIKYLDDNKIEQRQLAMLQLGLIYLRSKFEEKKGKEWILKGVELNPNSQLVTQVKQTLAQTNR